jgi:hypothetical protein
MDISLQQLAAGLGGEIVGNQVLAPGPGHSSDDRSLAILPRHAAPGGMLTHSFAGDDALLCKDYVRRRLGLPSPKPQRADNISRTDCPRKKIAKAGSTPATYIYQRADGTPYLRVVRPGFYQFHWDGKGWARGAPKGPKIPYRLPELTRAAHDIVLIVEGEKDVDNLAARGFIATTNSGGAEKWTSELNQYFRGRDIYIIPDNDEAGERHARQVSEQLAGVAREIRIVRLPGLEEKQDVSDWLEGGGTADELARLMESAPRLDSPEPSSLIISSADFVYGFVPPDFLIDGVMQRRFVYSLTAPTGTGKTAVALLLCACIALGRPFGEYQLEQGRVLYLAGENPDDVRMRWLAMAEAMNFDITAIPVHFLPGLLKLSEIEARIKAEIEKIGDVSLVVVDTSAAYFEGAEENANVEMGIHARRMRGLVSLPGGPCVLVACHPVKNAASDNLLPRGGGAFIAEMDGNLTLSKADAGVEMHWQGKFRGSDFAPIPFQLSSATTPKLRDSKGRPIPTVIATAMSARERSLTGSRSDDDMLLIAIGDHNRASMAGLANVLRWFDRHGKPDKSRVQRVSNRLKSGGYVKMARGALTLSEKGKNEAIRAKQIAELAREQYD